jgi:hypothetical protein
LSVGGEAAVLVDSPSEIGPKTAKSGGFTALFFAKKRTWMHLFWLKKLIAESADLNLFSMSS